MIEVSDKAKKKVIELMKDDGFNSNKAHVLKNNEIYTAVSEIASPRTMTLFPTTV